MSDDVNALENDDGLPDSAFFCEWQSKVDFVYGQGRRQQIDSLTRCYGPVITSANFEQHVKRLGRVEAIFSTWGMPVLDEARIDRLSGLKAIFYAAGSVQEFARPYLERGVAVISAWAANAVPVAEFTLAQIILANKGYFRNSREARNQIEGDAFVGTGNFGATVALLGAGQIGRKVIDLLRAFALRVIVFDPYLPEQEAIRLGVTKVSLEEAFHQGDVVSNHLADLPATVGMLRGIHFESMRENATFINTARPATLMEDEFFDVMRRRPDLTALLDVFTPNPYLPFHRLPNVELSTHIAGSQNHEVIRMADCVIEEFKLWRGREPLKHGVTLQMLEAMA